MRTTTKTKEKRNEAKETQEPKESQVLTVIEPDGGSPATSLRPIRLIDPQQIKIFEGEIGLLCKRYIRKSGESPDECKSHFFDYVAYCGKPEVFFIIGVDQSYKCRGYCLAHVMVGGIFFIRQAVIDPEFSGSVRGCWEFIERAAKSSGCRLIESSTKREEKAYGRWISKIGMKRECTVYRKGVMKDG